MSQLRTVNFDVCSPANGARSAWRRILVARVMAFATLVAFGTASSHAEGIEVREVEAKDVQNQVEGTDDLVYLEGAAAEFTVALPAHLGEPVPLGYGKSWRTVEVAKYVLDKARIRRIIVEATNVSKKKARLKVTVELTTEWFSQDVDLVVEVKDKENGKVLCTKSWDDLTIGGSGASGMVWGAGGPQLPTAQWNFTKETAVELPELLRSGRAVLRVALAIDDS